MRTNLSLEFSYFENYLMSSRFWKEITTNLNSNCFERKEEQTENPQTTVKTKKSRLCVKSFLFEKFIQQKHHGFRIKEKETVF